jgi:hypothetical protein
MTNNSNPHLSCNDSGSFVDVYRRSNHQKQLREKQRDLRAPREYRFDLHS